MENQLVIFEVAGEQYGVDIATVESIIKVQSITRVPHTPHFVEGITNLRGVVLPVIDLRKRFGLPATEATKDSRIIVVELKGNILGMLVDTVTEVLRIPDEAIDPPSVLVTTVDSGFIIGIARVENRLIILLELDKALTVREQAELQIMPEMAL